MPCHGDIYWGHVQWHDIIHGGEGSRLNIGSGREESHPSHVPKKQRPFRLQGQFLELSTGSMSDMS
jgi:hypothetical protein